MAFKKIFHYNLHPGPFGRVHRVYHCNKCLPLPLLWLRLTRRLQSLRGVLSLAISQSFQACTCCVTDLSTTMRCACSSVAYSMVHNTFQRYTCPSAALPPAFPALLWAYPQPNALRCSRTTLRTATDASRCTCCRVDMSLGQNPFRGIPAVPRT